MDEYLYAYTAEFEYQRTEEQKEYARSMLRIYRDVYAAGSDFSEIQKGLIDARLDAFGL